MYIQHQGQLQFPHNPIEVVETTTSQPKNQENPFHINGDVIKRLLLRNKFKSLKEAWEENVMYSSSITEITEDKNFKEIVKMGPSVVPFIMSEIEQEPSNLVWALNLIAGAKLTSNRRITITEACAIWVKLYKKGAIKV